MIMVLRATPKELVLKKLNVKPRIEKEMSAQRFMIPSVLTSPTQFASILLVITKLTPALAWLAMIRKLRATRKGFVQSQRLNVLLRTGKEMFARQFMLQFVGTDLI